MLHDRMEWYGHRLRDTHDLLHGLTGNGRGALGEQCVLAFTYSQQPSPAHLFIGYAWGLHLTRTVPVRAPIFRAIREGQKLGKACPRLVEQPVTDLLAMPIEEVRQRLNITPARWYHEVRRIWRAAGLEPYDLWNEQPAAAPPLAA